MIDFGIPRPRRRPSLTPMIDVVFLLLIFFMLASRFGVERVLPLTLAGQGADYSGPPRLVELDGSGLVLNGVLVTPEALVSALAGLTEGPQDVIVLRARDADVDLQALVSVMDLLSAAGHARLVLVD